MNRAITTSAIGASVLLAATGIAWWMRRGAPALELPPTVIPIVSPIITVEVAEQVLSHMEHLPSDEVTLVLHTDGGEVTACVLIADALRKFRHRRRSSRTWRSPAGR
jgi:ClpP class serine protease